MHYLLIYEFVPDYLDRRPAFRAAHLALAWQSVEKGELLLAGAFADPVDGAVLWFEADSDTIPKAFAAADPYVQNGLVTRWRVRPWMTTVGRQASNPVRPHDQA